MDILGFLRTQYKPAPGEFLPVDGKALVEKLAIRTRGAERGAKGLPQSHSKGMDEIEQEIIEAIRSQALDDERRCHEQLSLYAQRLKAADPVGTAAEMRATARQSITAFKAEALAARGELEQARREVIERRDALKHFRTKNALERPANPPKTHHMMYAILAVLFLIETVPNANFLSAGDELGFIGGYAVAIVFSLLNLASGFIAGRFGWTNARHRTWVRRIAGAFLGITLIALVIMINFLLAHYRVAAEHGMLSAAAAVTAWNILWTHPFAVGDALSLAMVGIGLLFSFVAMLEGYLWRDPYPGYEAISRHLRDAEWDWNKVVEERLNLLENVEQKHIEAIRAARSSLRDRQMQIPEILEARGRLVKSLALHITQLEGVARYALAAYRDANRGARKQDDQVPERFDAEWALEGIGKIELPPPPVLATDADWKAADVALERSVDQLQSAYEEAVRWIEELGQFDTAAESDAIGVDSTLANPVAVLDANGGIGDGRAA